MSQQEEEATELDEKTTIQQQIEMFKQRQHQQQTALLQHHAGAHPAAAMGLNRLMSPFPPRPSELLFCIVYVCVHPHHVTNESQICAIKIKRVIVY